MVKTILFLTKLIVTAFIVLLFSSCKYDINLGNRETGNGNITTQTRLVNNDFQKIDVSSGIEVVIEQTENKSILVEADENLQKIISTTVENGTLIIKTKKGYTATQTPKVIVKTPSISVISASSGSNISSANTLITNDIKVEADSGSEIKINVEADAISLTTESGSTIIASGKALKLETDSSSGSQINAEQLMANDVLSESSSGSTTTVSPILTLTANASSGSSISYTGTPKKVESKSSSGGSIGKE